MRDLSLPTQPSQAIQQRMVKETEQRRTQAGPAVGLPREQGACANIRKNIGHVIEGIADEIIGLSHAIHSHPEIGYEEFFACERVADVLRSHGFNPDVGVFGVDTAVRAEFTGAEIGDDTACPTIAILAEYDALPGIGHGCGHNVMAANSVGAFLALYELERLYPGSVKGRVVLQTTPAEENSTAKEILAIRGMLTGIDAAIQTHSYSHDLVHQTWLGVRRISAVFTGIPAHASSQPFMGRNALDAATLVLTGLGLLRQHILPMDRLHAVIVDGGEVANIIPERTEISLMVRSKYPETLKELVSRVEDILQGAALMTGTGLEIVTSSHTNEMPVRTNGPLAESWVRAQRERGREPLPAGVISETIAAGTDFGNVSLRVPGIHPLIQVAAPEVALHTRDMTDAAASPSGDRACLDGAYGLACVALDYLADPELQVRVRNDFNQSGGAIDVENFWNTKNSSDGLSDV